MKTREWKPEDGEKFELVASGNASVKLYRTTREDRDGYIYQITDYTAGRRRLRAFSNIAKARGEAKRIADQLATGKAAAAAMSNTQAESYGRAMELLRPTGISLEAAATIVVDGAKIVGADRIVEACRYFQLHGADKIVPRLVPAVVSELVAKKKTDKKSRRYVADLRARLLRFADKFAVDISTVTTADLQGWLDGLKLSPRSAKNFRGALGTLFKFAEARQYIARGSNPVTSTEQISTNGDGPIEIYTPEEIFKLLKNASKDFLPVVALGAFAGLRAAEVDRLEYKEIDVSGGFIHVAAHKAKTRSRRLVPIVPNLAKWLAPYSRRRGKVWTGSERDLLDARAETVKQSGVAWKANALRHSFISYRLAETQDAAKVALEAGNSPAMIFKHYRELVKPDAAKTWFAIAPEQPANVVSMNKEAAHA
jgi:site-specific recombinase XerD